MRICSGWRADLEHAPWRNRNFVYYGGPEYRIQREDVTTLLETGITHLQVGLRVLELGYVWGWVGDDGTPAPYFDNVTLKAYARQGPVITANRIDLAQDAFPAEVLNQSPAPVVVLPVIPLECPEPAIEPVGHGRGGKLHGDVVGGLDDAGLGLVEGNADDGDAAHLQV